MIARLMMAVGLWMAASPVAAQSPRPPAHIQTADEALAQDAATYAARHGVPLDDAIRRLRAEAETVAITDALASEFADRFVGIAIEHYPAFRLIVRLTGTDPVPGRIVAAGGMTVPVIFRPGLPATHAQLVAAITAYQAAIRGALSSPPGIGVDPRTGELVVFVSRRDADRDGPATLQARFAAMTGVPVRVRVVDRPELDMAEPVIEGGGRVIGVSPVDGRRYVCTAGFTVTDGTRFGVATAAHCPDTLSYIDPAGGDDVPLPMVGQWGWGHQDVQVNLTPRAVGPLFYADTTKTLARPVTGQRRLAHTRAGETVCHRGERTGYSCAEVELTDFAPAGDLCGGACLPTWITVGGPTCRNGDSGAPVFAGTIAFGLVKGGTYRADGSCAFYFYMSTDYLPDGWSLVRAVLPADTDPHPSPPSASLPLPSGEGRGPPGAVGWKG